jgi:hypothetical protein
MKPPREEAVRNFEGMDVSLADTAANYDRAVVDVGSNHEKVGAWRTRRGWSRGFDVIDSSVQLIKLWEAENELRACLISGTDAYHNCEGFPFQTTGYGFGGYGSQVYGD